MVFGTCWAIRSIGLVSKIDEINLNSLKKLCTDNRGERTSGSIGCFSVTDFALLDHKNNFISWNTIIGILNSFPSHVLACMLSQKVFLLYHPKNILFNHNHPFTRIASTWQSPKSIMVCIISKGSHCMVVLTMLKLVDRSLMSINKPRYNIGPLLSRNSVSAAIAFQECIKSLPSIGAKCWNCCSNVWNRWCLNSCHFHSKRGNAKTITRVPNSTSLEQGLFYLYCNKKNFFNLRAGIGIQGSLKSCYEVIFYGFESLRR